jgi:hypothetical protein
MCGPLCLTLLIYTILEPVGAPVDSSVIVPCFGDAATGARCEAGVLNRGGGHAAVARRAIQWRLNGFDFVPVTVDVFHKGDGIA